jgi:HAD superfamily hydrolase (TIGR01509 family)
LTVALLDIDGTLVDTNYQHALAWFRAFARHDVILPIWRIHRHIGMGGDQLVGALTDERTEHELGDAIRSVEGELYGEMIGEVRPMAGAHELLEELAGARHTVVLASSAKPEEVDHYLDLLDARELADAWTTAGDVEATKPAPDLITCSLEKAGADPGEAVMVGDSTWDVKAAQRAGVRSLAVMTGGFSEQELLEAGADAVFESVGELLHRLRETSLAPA